MFLFLLYLRLRSVSSGSAISSGLAEYQILEVKISKNERDELNAQVPALSAESMFAAIHGLLKEDPGAQEHFSFEMVSSGVEGIRFYVVVPKQHAKFIEGQIYAQYPASQIQVVEDYTPRFEAGHSDFEVASITLEKPEYFPIKVFRDFEVDPLSSITSAMAEVTESEEIWFQMVIRPIADVWQSDGQAYVDAVREGEEITITTTPFSSVFRYFTKEVVELSTNIIVGAFRYGSPTEDAGGYSTTTTVKLSPTQDLELKSIENKLSRMGFEVVIRVFSNSHDKQNLERNLTSVLASFKQFSSTASNNFISSRESNKKVALERYKQRHFDNDRSFILNTEELGTVFHFPSSSLDTPNISWVYSRKSEPPSNLPMENCNYIGYTTYRSKKTMFGLADGDDRLRHMYLIGKSGTGKSTLIQNMVAQDIKNGEGVGVLDPHGETIELILDKIPDERIDDVIYFDAADTERPLGLNLLEYNDPSQKNLMASGLVDAIKQHFDYSWGPRLEYLLNYAILTLLEVPGTTMLGITRLMEDRNYMNYILHQVKDPLVKKFWDQEFKEMKGNQKLVTEAIAPIQNKVNRFLASTTIRNILGQKNSTLDLWDAINNKKILLINLSKGKIGSDNANLLGALLVSRLQFFALQRAKIPYDDRTPFYLYVDEFQNFATGSFEEILSESRKYKLGLYMTHQFTAQLPDELLKAVFGNVGTIATFALGAPDARVMESEFAPYFSAEDIISLERFYVYVKLMIGGMTSHPFSGRILIPWTKEDEIVPKTTNRQRVINNSRQKYGVDREYVEGKINKWVEAKFDKGMAIAQEYRAKEEVQEENLS